MIQVRRATKERIQDKHRHRLLLKIGDKSYHLTQTEARKLQADLGIVLARIPSPERPEPWDDDDGELPDCIWSPGDSG